MAAEQRRAVGVSSTSKKVDAAPPRQTGCISSSRLAAKKILIFGGTGDIGAAVSTELLCRGAHVWLVGCESSDELVKIKQDLVAKVAEKRAARSSGAEVNNNRGVVRVEDQIFTSSCDVSNAEDVRATVAAVETTWQRGVDVVYVNAAIMAGSMQPPDAVADEVDAKQVGINVLGSVFSAKHAIKLLLKEKLPVVLDIGKAVDNKTLDTNFSSALEERSSQFPPTLIFAGSSSAYLQNPDLPDGLVTYRATKTAVHSLMLAYAQLYCKNSVPASKEGVVPTGPMIAGESVTSRATTILGEKVLRDLRVFAVDPGFVASRLGAEDTAAARYGITKPDPEALVKAKLAHGAISPEEAAEDIVWTLENNTEIESGRIYSRRKLMPW